MPIQSESDYEKRLLTVRKEQLVKVPNPGSEKKPCDNKYEGIGIRYNWAENDRLVIDAPPEFPAYKAGIRVGDTFMGIKIADGIGTVRIISRGRDLTYKIKTTMICFE
jgi:C-terminal processing protease CtpA/Prc